MTILPSFWYSHCLNCKYQFNEKYESESKLIVVSYRKLYCLRCNCFTLKMDQYKTSKSIKYMPCLLSTLWGYSDGMQISFFGKTFSEFTLRK